MNDSNELKQDNADCEDTRPAWQKNLTMIVMIIILFLIGLVIGRFIGGFF